MKKKRSINAKVLKDLGLEPPTRVVRKQKPSPYHKPGTDSRHLDEVYEALKKILVRHEKKFKVKGWQYEVDEQVYPSYYLHIPSQADRPEIPFLGVAKNRSYITFHLHVLMDEKFAKLLSKQLELHRHGQTVLNFTEIDRPLFKQLAKLTADLVRMAEDGGYI